MTEAPPGAYCFKFRRGDSCHFWNAVSPRLSEEWRVSYDQVDERGLRTLVFCAGLDGDRWDVILWSSRRVVR